MTPNKISKVAELARNQQEQSAQQLKHRQSEHEQSQSRLDQLHKFREEYEQRLTGLGENGIAARQLQDYRQFLNRLGSAIDQQKTEIQQHATQVETAREAWVEKSRRQSALERLMTQADQQLRQAQDKQAQKEADEKTLANFAHKQ